MKKSRTWIIFVLAGVLLVAAGLMLWGYNNAESNRAFSESNRILPIIKETINEDKDNKVINVEGNDYMGYLSIESINLEVPVMRDWDYDKLEIAPCRQKGEVANGDLIIAGHNFKSQFGRLREIKSGDAIYFTDTKGNENLYNVVNIGVIDEDSADRLNNSKYDLVLYTCTDSGKERVYVGAENLNLP